MPGEGESEPASDGYATWDASTWGDDVGDTPSVRNKEIAQPYTSRLRRDRPEQISDYRAGWMTG